LYIKLTFSISLTMNVHDDPTKMRGCEWLSQWSVQGLCQLYRM
jgi:hypothetical protein